MKDMCFRLHVSYLPLTALCELGNGNAAYGDPFQKLTYESEKTDERFLHCVIGTV